MKIPHFAIPEIYGETLSYYELLRNLVNKMNELVENYNTIPDQIDEAVANLDASQLFSAVLDQIIDSIATDNTKSANAVKVYKKHDLLYATFNDTVNLYESLIDFTTGTETELIVGSNIREVNISELFIELRKLIEGEYREREQADTALQTNIDNEAQARTQADTALQTNIDNEAQARTQADNTKVNISDVLSLEQIKTTDNLVGKVASADALKNINNLYGNLNIVYQSNIRVKFNDSAASGLLNAPKNAISILSVNANQGGGWIPIKTDLGFKIRDVDDQKHSYTFDMNIIWACSQ